jgi:hypothetical protein
MNNVVFYKTILLLVVKPGNVVDVGNVVEEYQPVYQNIV